MQFTRNGPDIPERLLQAHEEGRVVMFCGAGVSYPAGLPSFEGLVHKLYADLHVVPSREQQSAISDKQFDTAVGLLEETVVGRRAAVRRALKNILLPRLELQGATDTHSALLALGRNREGRTRLITTNFDRMFAHVIARDELNVPIFKAPLLPIPKSQWDGLVCLHGLLESQVTTSQSAECLVLTSGEFGLAYLTERWASRFASDLFRKFSVCFVGYSIGDPVLRYIMDALAADRLLGESVPEAFAFVDFASGEEGSRADEWRSKHVTPVLYEDCDNHAVLHKTLKLWAETYRDGVRGKERIVVECAQARPLACTKEDDFVGRLMWALSDQRGVPAGLFADMNPAPKLDWLGPLCDRRYGPSDLARFGVQSAAVIDKQQPFSLTFRPAPYPYAPFMGLFAFASSGCRWDDGMRHLARWLVRHIGNHRLLLWVVENGAQMHPELARMIERKLDERGEPGRDMSSAEPDAVPSEEPQSAPSPALRKLWRLILSGRVKSGVHDNELYRWRRQYESDGMTIPLRLRLRDLLAPRVSLRAPLRTPEDEGPITESEAIEQIVRWEIVLSADGAHATLAELRADPRWKADLPGLLQESVGLLRDALDLMRELGGVEEKSDRSYVYHASISEHRQNRRSNDWTALIDLTRDAWLATVEGAPGLARAAAEVWWSSPYPLFRRLAMFAAAESSAIPTHLAVDWLLESECWWLWTPETEREALRLLASLAPRLDATDFARVEGAVLAGPPRALLRDDLEDARWRQVVDREVWLRLIRLGLKDAHLGQAARERLATLEARYPGWRRTPDEREEFPFWIGDGDEMGSFLRTPTDRRKLVQWLKDHPTATHWQRDDWRQRCNEDFPHTSSALCALSKEGVWLTERWRDALLAWSDAQLLNRSWRRMAQAVDGLPDSEMTLLAHDVSWWLEANAKTFEGGEGTFFRLVERILALDHEDVLNEDDPIFNAINSPVGHATEALLQWWFRRQLEDNQGIPVELRAPLDRLCSTSEGALRHGRTILAVHLITLFRIDPDWFRVHLVPWFDWGRAESQARCVWIGFLWSPRLYRPLMEVLRAHFLETAAHYTKLGDRGAQYASLLAHAAIDPKDLFLAADLARATRALPEEGLRESVLALVAMLDSSGTQRSEFWNNRVAGYLREIWPTTQEHRSQRLAEALGRLCVAAGEAFPKAVEVLGEWMMPVEFPGYLLSRVAEAKVSQQFPSAALHLLGGVIGKQTQIHGSELGVCLRAILDADPTAESDARFQRLWEFWRQHG